MEITKEELWQEMSSVDSLYSELSDLKKRFSITRSKYQKCLITLKTTREELECANLELQKYKVAVVTVAQYNAAVSQSADFWAQLEKLQKEYNDLVNSSEIRCQAINMELLKVTDELKAARAECSASQKKINQLEAKLQKRSGTQKSSQKLEWESEKEAMMLKIADLELVVTDLTGQTEVLQKEKDDLMMEKDLSLKQMEVKLKQLTDELEDTKLQQELHKTQFAFKDVAIKKDASSDEQQLDDLVAMDLNLSDVSDAEDCSPVKTSDLYKSTSDAVTVSENQMAMPVLTSDSESGMSDSKVREALQSYRSYELISPFSSISEDDTVIRHKQLVSPTHNVISDTCLEPNKIGLEIKEDFSSSYKLPTKFNTSLVNETKVTVDIKPAQVNHKTAPLTHDMEVNTDLIPRSSIFVQTEPDFSDKIFEMHIRRVLAKDLSMFASPSVKPRAVPVPSNLTTCECRKAPCVTQEKSKSGIIEIEEGKLLELLWDHWTSCSKKSSIGSASRAACQHCQHAVGRICKSSCACSSKKARNYKTFLKKIPKHTANHYMSYPSCDSDNEFLEKLSTRPKKLRKQRHKSLKRSRVSIQSEEQLSSCGRPAREGCIQEGNWQEESDDEAEEYQPISEQEQKSVDSGYLKSESGDEVASQALLEPEEGEMRQTRERDDQIRSYAEKLGYLPAKAADDQELGNGSKEAEKAVGIVPLNNCRDQSAATVKHHDFNTSKAVNVSNHLSCVNVKKHCRSVDKVDAAAQVETPGDTNLKTRNRKKIKLFLSSDNDSTAPETRPQRPCVQNQTRQASTLFGSSGEVSEVESSRSVHEQPSPSREDQSQSDTQSSCGELTEGFYRLGDAIEAKLKNPSSRLKHLKCSKMLCSCDNEMFGYRVTKVLRSGRTIPIDNFADVVKRKSVAHYKQVEAPTDQTNEQNLRKTVKKTCSKIAVRRSSRIARDKAEVPGTPKLSKKCNDKQQLVSSCDQPKNVLRRSPRISQYEKTQRAQNTPSVTPSSNKVKAIKKNRASFSSSYRAAMEHLIKMSSHKPIEGKQVPKCSGVLKLSESSQKDCTTPMDSSQSENEQAKLLEVPQESMVARVGSSKDTRKTSKESVSRCVRNLNSLQQPGEMLGKADCIESVECNSLRPSKDTVQAPDNRAKVLDESSENVGKGRRIAHIPKYDNKVTRTIKLIDPGYSLKTKNTAVVNKASPAVRSPEWYKMRYPKVKKAISGSAGDCSGSKTTDNPFLSKKARLSPMRKVMPRANHAITDKEPPVVEMCERTTPEQVGTCSNETKSSSTCETDSSDATAAFAKNQRLSRVSSPSRVKKTASAISHPATTNRSSSLEALFSLKSSRSSGLSNSGKLTLPKGDQTNLMDTTVGKHHIAAKMIGAKDEKPDILKSPTSTSKSDSEKEINRKRAFVSRGSSMSVKQPRLHRSASTDFVKSVTSQQSASAPNQSQPSLQTLPAPKQSPSQNDADPISENLNAQLLEAVEVVKLSPDNKDKPRSTYKRPTCHRKSALISESAPSGLALEQKKTAQMPLYNSAALSTFEKGFVYRKSAPEHSPASPEPCKETVLLGRPKVIPLEPQPRVLSEGRLLSADDAKKVLQRLLNFPNDREVGNFVVATMLDQPAKLVARLVLDVVSKDMQGALEAPTVPVAPYLTVIQEVLLVLLVKLEEQGRQDIVRSFMDKIQQSILASRDPLSLKPLARFHTALCKWHVNYIAVRGMIADALSQMGDLAVPYIYYVITVWVEVIPHSDVPAHDTLMTRAIIEVLRAKTCSEPSYNLQNLRMMLFHHYKYSFDSENPEKLLMELFKSCIEKQSEYYELVIVIFCQHQNRDWLANQMETKLKPHVHRAHSVNEICEVIRLVGFLTRKIYAEVNSPVLEMNKLWLQSFCNGLFPDSIQQEAAVILKELLQSSGNLKQNAQVKC